MRMATIFLAAVVAIGVTGSAPAEDQAPQSATDDYVPCGCGGPKAIYAARYGTVQPPALQQSNPIVRPEAEQPAASEQPEPDTNAGG